MILSLFFFRGQFYTAWNLVFADLILVSIPVIIAFIFAQRHIVKPIPYYAQLKQILVDRIERGDFPDGKISSENELADRYEVAVSTVRKTLTQLIYKGKIYRIKGIGTFIKNPNFK